MRPLSLTCRSSPSPNRQPILSTPLGTTQKSAASVEGNIHPSPCTDAQHGARHARHAASKTTGRSFVSRDRGNEMASRQHAHCSVTKGHKSFNPKLIHTLGRDEELDKDCDTLSSSPLKSTARPSIPSERFSPTWPFHYLAELFFTTWLSWYSLPEGQGEHWGRG